MSIVIFGGNESPPDRQLAIPPNGKIGRAKRLAVPSPYQDSNMTMMEARAAYCEPRAKGNVVQVRG